MLFFSLCHDIKHVDGLRQDFVAAEKGMDMLENMCEEQEHKRRILDEEGKLAAYTLHREKEFERLKGRS